MRKYLPRWGCLIAAGLGLVVSPTLAAQGVPWSTATAGSTPGSGPAIVRASSVAPATPATLPTSPGPSSTEELLRRLEAAEARIRQLEKQGTPTGNGLPGFTPQPAGTPQAAFTPAVPTSPGATSPGATASTTASTDSPSPGSASNPGPSLFSAMNLWTFAAHDPEVAAAIEQSEAARAAPEDKAKKKKWYEKMSIRGYAQFRYNETSTSANSAAPAQYVGDRSIGEHQNFLLRRARLIFAGDVSEHVYFYLQPDFASGVTGVSDATHYTQIRDWYADVYVDVTKVHRFRVGQSKVPYGWENLQSSSNRLCLDRNDAFNSATPNERDLGVFYYWTPEHRQELFRYVLENGLKGSGNYGCFGLGVYNGQGGSFQEQNDNVHWVGRFTWPFQLGNGQVMEVGVQGLQGKYSVAGAAIRAKGVGPAITPLNTLANTGKSGVFEERLGFTYILYPQPFGLQVEYTFGSGPGLNDAQTAVVERPLHGGYIQASYKIDTHCWGTFFPFCRYQYFKGGYRSQANAPYSRISEVEAGVEWQIQPAMELTLSYMNTDRTNTQARNVANLESYQQFTGHVFRMQFQFNY